MGVTFQLILYFTKN